MCAIDGGEEEAVERLVAAVCEGSLVGLRGLFEPTGLAQQAAAPAPRLGVMRLEAQRIVVGSDRFVAATEHGESVAAAVGIDGARRVTLPRAIVARQRLGMVAEHRQRHAALRPRVQIIGSRGERGVERFERCGGPAELEPRRAEVGERRSAAGNGGQRALEGIGRLGMAAGLVVRDAVEKRTLAVFETVGHDDDCRGRGGRRPTKIVAAMQPFIRLHPNDDVLIARAQLVGGAEVEGVAVRGLIPAGHKIAVRDIAAGEPVRRYDQIIGFASKPIARGEHVHVHNLDMGPDKGASTGAATRDYAIGAGVRPKPARREASFMGIRRADGRVATRNYIGVLTSVNCSATAARAIADHFSRTTNPQALAAYPNVDGIVALTHGTGCGMDTNGTGMRILERTLTGYATHANFAGVLVVGLGCEANQINAWLTTGNLVEGENLRVFNIQDTGGTTKTVAKGIALVNAMLPAANAAVREPCSAEHITIGLQCGGSDGYSGISANPALGAAVDLLVQHGGTAILSETPEIYGAEHLLTRRAVRPDIAEKLLERIRWWERYTAINDGEMNNNPSPGNKAGGLTTILEKSLGAVAKGGTMNLEAVLEYAEPVTTHGFVYMDTPGYDPVSATGQVAGGANLICFTTGRGSAYGCAPSPSLKLATNTALWKRQEDDMDINCGEIVDGTSTVQAMGERIFELVLETASGHKSKSERHGYGQSEFVPWQVGAVM